MIKQYKYKEYIRIELNSKPILGYSEDAKTIIFKGRIIKMENKNIDKSILDFLKKEKIDSIPEDGIYTENMIKSFLEKILPFKFIIKEEQVFKVNIIIKPQVDEEQILRFLGKSKYAKYFAYYDKKLILYTQCSLEAIF